MWEQEKCLKLVPPAPRFQPVEINATHDAEMCKIAQSYDFYVVHTHTHTNFIDRLTKIHRYFPCFCSNVFIVKSVVVVNIQHSSGF